MSLLVESGLQEQKDFLRSWPLERLERMKLEEYTNSDKDTAFIYWLEKKTENTGSIWGGSAFKFGIFRRANLTTEVTQDNRKTDGEYSWYSKYGETKDEAFQNIKSIIVNIAKASVERRFNDIEEFDLGESVKWKIAFLYNNNGLIPIFKRELLVRVAENQGIEEANSKKTSELHQLIIKQKSSNIPMLEYAEKLWSLFSLDHFYFVIDKFLKQAQTNNLKKQGFPTRYSDLKVRVSFGAGNSARIPWIALLKEPNSVTDGIYPLFLYYKESNTLILAYGVSETKSPQKNWSTHEELLSINDWYLKKYGKKPDRYGSSYFKADYYLDNELDAEKLQADLDEIIKEYKHQEVRLPEAGTRIPDRSKEKKYWIIAPGEKARKWDECLEQGIISLGWDDVGDLLQYHNREDIRSALQSYYPEGSKSKKMDSLALYEFVYVMKTGDVLIPKKGIKEYGSSD